MVNVYLVIRIVPPVFGKETNLPTSGHLVDVIPPEIEAVLLCLIQMGKHNTYFVFTFSIPTAPD